MNFVLKAIIILATHFFLLLVVERKYNICEKIFKKSRSIKAIVATISFIVLSGVLGVYVDKITESYIFLVMLGIYLYITSAGIIGNLGGNRA